MPRFRFPSPRRQLFIQAFLDSVRQTGLHEALQRAVKTISAATLRSEMDVYAPEKGLKALHGTGVRDEEVFVIPAVLRHAPGLLAYYRLLLGVSQKAFYTTTSGLIVFKSMEERQVVREEADFLLDALCTEMNEAIETLVLALPQATLKDDIRQLPLLTLGAQADGAWRGQIGRDATQGVFEAMKAIVRGKGRTMVETEISITIENSAGRQVTLALAPDPDVVIREEVDGEDVYKVAIEIKGGRDYANLHNRVGEAEKSHAKARASGAQDCWTVISLDKADMDRLRQESATTREWFDLAEVLKHDGPSWDRLTRLTRSAMGI
jgi:hypothetical protein